MVLITVLVPMDVVVSHAVLVDMRTVLVPMDVIVNHAVLVDMRGLLVGATILATTMGLSCVVGELGEPYREDVVWLQHATLVLDERMTETFMGSPAATTRAERSGYTTCA